MTRPTGARDEKKLARQRKLWGSSRKTGHRLFANRRTEAHTLAHRHASLSITQNYMPETRRGSVLQRLLEPSAHYAATPLIAVPDACTYTRRKDMRPAIGRCFRTDRPVKQGVTFVVPIHLSAVGSERQCCFAKERLGPGAGVREASALEPFG